MTSPKYCLNADIENSLKKNDLKENHHYINKMNKPKMNECGVCGKRTLLTTCAGCLRWEKIINKKHESKISCNNKTYMDELFKFPVGMDKIPVANMWCGDKGMKNKHLWRKNLKGNCGIPCGKVNGIMVVDLDLYKLNKSDSEFIKTFGDDYVEKFDTLTQKTTSGGEHLIFQYDEDFGKGTNNATHQVDIKNDGGYIVGAGSKCFIKQDKDKPVSQKRVGQYKVINETNIKPIPTELKEWLIKNIMSKDKKIIQRKERESKAIKMQSSIGYYCYNITEAKCKSIVSKIPDEYYTEHDKWLIFATAMKSMDMGQLFLKMCAEHPKTNYTNPNHPPNVKQYNGIQKHFNINAVEHIFNQAVQSTKEKEDGTTETHTYRTYVDYIKYKPTIKSKLKEPKKCGEWDKIGKHITLPKNKKCVVIKSDTGTGKTTIVKEYLANQSNCKFISMVSRISLGEEQYSIFRDAGISCKLYNEEDSWFQEGDSMVICVDSLKKIARGNFGEYVIFMDEYNSLIEHLFSSKTLNDRRTQVFQILCNVLKEAKQIFCVDADLQGHTLELLDYLDIDYDLYINTYQHNKGIKANEYFNIESFTEDLVKSDKFLMCCDSKSSCIKVANDNFDKIPLTEEEKERFEGLLVFKDDKGYVVVITSDNDKYCSLDSFDRAIISPKIIYGLDSQIERDVFCWYEEHTINPRMMVQQIARTRNIKQINYIFFKKIFQQEKFIDIKETHEYIKKIDDYAVWEMLGSQEDNDIWMKVMSVIMYNNDCYDTNKFAHFRNLLHERGVILDSSIGRTGMSTLAKMKKDYKDDQLENFDKDHPKVQEINELLKIPKDKMDDFKELFILPKKRLQNQMAIKYVIKSGITLDDKLATKEDYNYNKMKSDNYKLVFLEKFMKGCGITHKNDMIAKNSYEQVKSQQLWNEVDDIFRLRLTEKDEDGNKKTRTLDFTKTEDCSLGIEKMMGQIFGTTITIPYEPTEAQKATGNDFMTHTKLKLFKTKRKTKNKVKYTINTINPDFFEYQMKIGQFRNTECRTENLSWDFGTEDMNYNKKINMEQNDDGEWVYKEKEMENCEVCDKVKTTHSGYYTDELNEGCEGFVCGKCFMGCYCKDEYTEDSAKESIAEAKTEMDKALNFDL